MAKKGRDANGKKKSRVRLDPKTMTPRQWQTRINRNNFAHKLEVQALQAKINRLERELAAARGEVGSRRKAKVEFPAGLQE